jgi:DNA-binding IclR family transcriptional regulator
MGYWVLTGHKEMKTINKALNILELFMTNKNDELAVRDIVEATGLKKSSAHRIISTLVKRGFLKQHRKRGKYSLGVRIHDISGTTIKETDAGNKMVPHIIVELSRLINESVYFTVWHGSDILLSHAFANRESSESTPLDWESINLHQSCVGKIVLSNMSNEDLHRYFRRFQSSNNRNGNSLNIERIEEQLEAIKREGIAFEDEEMHIGVSGVAAGVQNAEGETIGAVYIMGPAARLTHAELVKIAPSIQRCASKISSELGSQA